NARAKANPHDRSLRAHQPQRAENLHHARGMRAALQGTFRRRLEGRAAQAGIWQDQPQQQDPRDRRSRRAGRQALYRDRVRRDPNLPPREDRKVSAQERGQEIRRAAMADDPTHRVGPMFGQWTHFKLFAPKGSGDYSMARYTSEIKRLYE